MNSSNQSSAGLPYVVGAFFAAALFSLNYAIGAALTIATGTPGASGLVTGLTTALTMYLACYVLNRGWKAGVLVFGLYCLFAWPTVLMGPPGAYKILVGVVAGGLFGLVLRFPDADTVTQRNSSPWRAIAAWSLFTFAIVIGIWLAFNSILLSLPGKERFMAAIWVFGFAFFSIGLIGLYIARRVAPRLNATLTFGKLRPAHTATSPSA